MSASIEEGTTLKNGNPGLTYVGRMVTWSFPREGANGVSWPVVLASLCQHAD
jgi:hypothetical protein